MVYAKRPFASPQQVLAILGRYTHRTAIGNRRLLSLGAGRGRWRDRAHDNEVQVMDLPAEGFIHRFPLHVLPRGFQCVRHVGLLTNRHKAAYLAQVRATLELPAPKEVLNSSVRPERFVGLIHTNQRLRQAQHERKRINQRFPKPVVGTGSTLNPDIS